MVLVTGGAGYVGSHFVAMLEDAGIPYLVVDNLSRSSGALVRTDRLVEGDIADGKLIESLCKENGVNAAVHFAAFAYVGESVHNPEIYYENNVVKSHAFFSSLRRAGVENVVFSSTCATYGIPPDGTAITEDTPQHPINPYGRTKLMIEHMLLDYEKAYGMRSAILRYFNAAGASEKHKIAERHDPETHVIPLALRAACFGEPFSIFGDDFPTPDGTCVRDFIHVDDLATAHLAAIRTLLTGAPSVQVNLGTGAGASVKEVVSAVERVTGRAVSPSIGPRREGDPPVLVANVKKAKEIFGWEARYRDLDRIVKSAYEAMLPERIS